MTYFNLIFSEIVETGTGGGIHGVSLAYYLTKSYASQVDVTLIEKTKIAAAASGKAGGFLARDWGSGPTSQLHKVSFNSYAD